MTSPLTHNFIKFIITVYESYEVMHQRTRGRWEYGKYCNVNFKKTPTVVTGCMIDRCRLRSASARDISFIKEL